MDSAQLIKAFAATIQASLHGLQLLEPVLSQEQDALTGRDPERLEQLARDKLALLKQLQHSVDARDRLQQLAGSPGGLEGGAVLVGKLNQEALSAEWQEMESLARQVAAMNDRNGQLAMQGQRAAREAIGILTGRPESNDTYAGLKGRGKRAAGYSLGKV